jgi:phosphatidylinositol glycan class C protein
MSVLSVANSVTSDRSRLAPEDALRFSHVLDTSAPVADADGLLRLKPREHRHRSKSRRRKGAWKKLLWVKQSHPDNYTDEETFLDALQRNPRLQPYDFWPLVGESTVIVQQVCTMIVFVCCFSGIIQEKVSPVTIVSVGSVGTVLGWILWDMWVEQEQKDEPAFDMASEDRGRHDGPSRSPSMKDLRRHAETPSRSPSQKDLASLGLHLAHANSASMTKSQISQSRRTSIQSVRLSTIAEPHHQVAASGQNTPKLVAGENENVFAPYSDPTSRWSPRTQRRLATAKSAVLIYCALLGLSPILKSLTKSTASDSIWAISFWLMCINVIFFDYGRGVGANFPASLSTNAALMASTVLASRLESTRHVFSLTLFSIEVFGLFPVFRRYLRYISWRGHLCLTWFLVMGAGGGVALVISDGGWKSAVVGIVLGQSITAFAMGLCGWWLIGLQRYKNEIYGPWDPARPVIRRWD